jgi:opine dehydrogenase
MEKIAVLGAGAGGCATAGILTQRGYTVTLWNRSEEPIKPIIKKGGIEFTGYINGFVQIFKATLEIEEAVKGADLICITVPAFGQREIAEKCAPYVEDGQIILLNPGSAGSIEFVEVLREKQVEKDITIAESITLTVGRGRTIEPGKVRINSCEKWLERTAAFPGKKTEKVINDLKEICNPKPAKNVLEVGLLNVNFIVHPIPTILNIGSAELDKLFNPYHDGVSPSVLRCMEQLDIEKQSVLKALGIEPISCEDIYKKEFGMPHGIPQHREPPAGGWTREEERKRGRGWEERYIKEDVQYGLVLISSLGDQFGVSTPITDAIVELGSVITKTDFWKTGRTMEKLGISNLSSDQLDRFLYEGELKGPC